MRLIDADRLLEIIREQGRAYFVENGQTYDNCVYTYANICKTIETFPTAFKKKKAKWQRSFFDPEVVCCSNCGYSFSHLGPTPFCPNCGAMMKEG